MFGLRMRAERARTLKIFPDRVDRSLSAVGQPEITSVAGLHLMSTRIMSRVLFLRLRRQAFEVFEVFTNPAAPTPRRCTRFQQIMWGSALRQDFYDRVFLWQGIP